MLARKRGALQSKRRKMKKNAPTALQTDVVSDEEWDKILEREGLVLVDIYSEWSGPCTGMISVLKKIKIEMGGDSLSYATARCDNITSLARFRGKSEPVWMFIRGGKNINFMFGANCPKLIDLLTKELKRLKSNQPPEFSVDTFEQCPVETERIKMLAELYADQEAERLAHEEAENRRKYEAELEFYVDVLRYETCIILFPWMFVDDEGNRLEKLASPVYVELVQQVLPQQFKIEQEIDIQLDVDNLAILQKECEYELNESTKQLLTEGVTVCIRLFMKDKLSDMDVDNLLIDLMYGEPIIPEAPDELINGCFVDRNLPPLPDLDKDTLSGTSAADDKPLFLTTVWVPFNPRNRIVVFRTFFSKYVHSKYPFVDPDDETPIVLFKFDSPRRRELQVVMETYKSEILHFGVFARDVLPNPQLIAISMDSFENEVEVKTNYEVFICVIKKVKNEAFLSFAGIGPYHVSENHECAKEEVKQYFPRTSEDMSEVASVDENKPQDDEQSI